MRVKLAIFFGTSVAALAAILVGCSQSVVQPISNNGVSDITTYFWKVNQPSPTVYDSNNTNPHLQQGALSFDDSAQFLQVKVYGYPVLNCIVNQDSILAIGFTANSALNIPSKSYLSSSDTEISMLQPPYSAALYNFNGQANYVVGTDSGLLYYNTVHQPDTFQSFALPGTRISALLVNQDQHQLIVGTNSGTLLAADLTSFPTISPWKTLTTAPSPAMQLFTVVSSIFMRLENQPGVWVSQSGSTPVQLPFGTSETLSTIGIRASIDTTIFAASTTGQIGAYEINTARTSPFISIAGVTTVYGFATQGSEVLAATNNGIYTWSGASSNSWNPIAGSLATYKPVTAIAINNSEILFASQGRIYQGTTAGVSNYLQPIDTSVVQVGLNSSVPWVLSRHDFETTPQGGSGLTSIPNFWPYNPGGLLLMQRNLFSGDSSWRAGTLVDSLHNSHRITGRVLAHLDSLHIQGLQLTYPDVLVIRYANETSLKGPNTSLNYWIVYYAKNSGPVMIDNYSPTSPFDRREIGP